MSDGIETTIDGPILEVRLNRPKANAIDLVASRRLNDIFTSFRDDPQLRVAIVTGAGDRFFCAGWDLKAAAGGEKSDSDWELHVYACQWEYIIEWWQKWELYRGSKSYADWE